MIETKFKVLMFNGYYVNSNLLGSGCFQSPVPTIYDKKATIESIVSRGWLINENAGCQVISEAYFNNLKKCELVEVELNFNEVGR